MLISNPKLRHSLVVIVRHVAVLMLSVASQALSAAELLYVFEPHCAPCLAFDHDIGGIYSKTEEARIAPLRRLNINTIHGKHIVLKDRQLDLDTDIIGTPTFILINDGREIDRFSGYSQDELFWMSLQRLLNRLPPS